jgi:hypothetical protein
VQLPLRKKPLCAVPDGGRLRPPNESHAKLRGRGHVLKPERHGGCREQARRRDTRTGRETEAIARPGLPADPDVRDYRIRLLESRVCCIGSPDPLFVDVPLTQNDSSTRSRCVSFRRFRDSALRFRPLAPTGDSSPASQVLSECSDFPPSVPSRSFRSPGGTTDCCSSRGSGELLFPAPRRNKRRCLNALPSTHTRGDGGISRFPGNPFANMRLLFDRGGPDASGHCDVPDVAFRAVDGGGSAFGHLSRLNHTACSLAVYASRLGLLRSTPRKTRFPLAAILDGAGLSPVGLHQEVPLCASTHIVSPRRGLSWRTNRRDAVTLATQQPARPTARSRAAPVSALSGL